MFSLCLWGEGGWTRGHLTVKVRSACGPDEPVCLNSHPPSPLIALLRSLSPSLSNPNVSTKRCGGVGMQCERQTRQQTPFPAHVRRFLADDRTPSRAQTDRDNSAVLAPALVENRPSRQLSRSLCAARSQPSPTSRPRSTERTGRWGEMRRFRYEPGDLLSPSLADGSDSAPKHFFRGEIKGAERMSEVTRRDSASH